MSDAGDRIAARYGIARSAGWSSIERAHLARHPGCIGCRRPGARVEVHHVFPFHFCLSLGRPDLELDERNLVTLCGESDGQGAGNHHLLLGHFDDYESMNLHVRSEALERFHGMTAVQLRANAEWAKLAARRPPHLAAMSDADLHALRRLMNELMPPRR